MKTYHRKTYTAKGIVTTTALGLLATAGIMYGAQSCGEALESIKPEQRAPYEIVLDEYSKLDDAQRTEFIEYAWGTASSEHKAQIVGDDLGIKVSDIYSSGIESTLSR